MLILGTLGSERINWIGDIGKFVKTNETLFYDQTQSAPFQKLIRYTPPPNVCTLEKAALISLAGNEGEL